ncbi:hypothetical protein PENFLA_c020G08017 [Penicillium flavigenum]|uniref:Major facilitator superfamily (MFS) profile domain-containing protein n=1 Tax=Penicillium flavigenum TaxID=254877 RepID=A0A1V6SYD5_9EURO|nr:hypothetical protein PENFLA_c020G08017 [Penicillium flavigenum]
MRSDAFLVGGFMNLVSLGWVIWLNVILFGVLLVLVVFFLPETLYPRTRMLHQMPAIQSGSNDGLELEVVSVELRSANDSDLPRTTNLPFINIKPVPGMRHPKPWDSILLTWSIFRIFAVTIPLWAFSALIYWWNPAAMTMIPGAYVQFSPQIQGLLFVGMLLGIVFAEICCSGSLSDYICAQLTAKNNNIRVAEMRLWLIYPAFVLTSAGLVLWGISVDRGYHWMVGQVAFFLFSVGFQMSNTVLATYLVDSYPLQSISVITYYSVIINLAGFTSPIIQFSSSFLNG